MDVSFLEEQTPRFTKDKQTSPRCGEICCQVGLTDVVIQMPNDETYSIDAFYVLTGRLNGARPTELFHSHYASQ